MKFFKVFSFCVVSACLLTACHKGGEGIITVNDRPIYESEYKKMYKEITSSPQYSFMKEQLKDKKSAFSLMTKERIVGELILKNIVEAEIEKRNITVSDKEIEEFRKKLTEQIGGEEKLKEMMAHNGISKKTFEEELVKDIQMNKLVESIDKTKITDADTKNYYNKNKKQFNFPDRVRASHILFEGNPDKIRKDIIENDKVGKYSANEIEALVQEKMANQLALATTVRKLAVNNPKDFPKYAKKYSFDKVSGKNGGDLGFFTHEQMVKPFADAAFNLKMNTVSDIVQTQFGYHIIIVTDRAKAGMQPYEKVKGEIAEYLKQQKRVEVLQKLFSGLKNSAVIVYNDKNYDPDVIKVQIKEAVAKRMQQIRAQYQQRQEAK